MSTRLIENLIIAAFVISLGVAVIADITHPMQRTFVPSYSREELEELGPRGETHSYFGTLHSRTGYTFAGWVIIVVVGAKPFEAFLGRRFERQHAQKRQVSKDL